MNSHNVPKFLELIANRRKLEGISANIFFVVAEYNERKIKLTLGVSLGDPTSDQC